MEMSIFIDTDELERVQSYPTCTVLQPEGWQYMQNQCIPKEKAGSRHRVIINAYKGKMVDHKNGDTLDNRKILD